MNETEQLFSVVRAAIAALDSVAAQDGNGETQLMASRADLSLRRIRDIVDDHDRASVLTTVHVEHRDPEYVVVRCDNGVPTEGSRYVTALSARKRARHIVAKLVESGVRAVMVEDAMYAPPIMSDYLRGRKLV